MNAVFFEISNENNFSNKDDNDLGSLFLKYSIAKPIVITLDNTTPADQTPVSKGSGVIESIPGILTVSEAKTSAGNITDTKLIKTILIEKRKTINGIILLDFTCGSESVLSKLALFFGFFTNFLKIKSICYFMSSCH
jgi:hypothetical protein